MDESPNFSVDICIKWHIFPRGNEILGLYCYLFLAHYLDILQANDYFVVPFETIFQALETLEVAVS